MTQPWKRNVAEAHIRSLCRKHKIAIRFVKGWDWIHACESSESARLVHIPHANNARQYLVALHEIGHLLGPLGVTQRNEHPDISPLTYHVLTEASAWGWAVEHIHTDLDRSIALADFTATIGRGTVSHCWAVASDAAHGR